MARSPLTLAAAVSSALPGAVVVGVAALTEHAEGRFDSALAQLDDGTSVVIRVATDDESADELRRLARALQAVTGGVRAQLPFTVPILRGRVDVDGRPAVVVDQVSGYRVDAAHIPAGRGVATSLGAALAAVHALPLSVARDAELPELTPPQVRAEAGRLLDRVAAGRLVPVPLVARWSRALAADRLWRFASTVTLGGVTPECFVVRDVAGVPSVRGVLAWQGLGVGDPAADVQWLSSAPEAADDVYAAYASSTGRAPDPGLRVRARLYAELEFARWLVYGRDHRRDDVVADAVALLTSLSDTVGDDDLAAEPDADVDDAIARLGDIPAAVADVDTSMQTDAFRDEDIDIASFGGARDADDTARATSSDTADWGDEDAAEADRASEATLRRWAASD